MEFLAESIGLLDIDEQPQPSQEQQQQEEEGVQEQKQSKVPPASSTSESYYGLSFPTNFSSFAGIASSSFDKDEAKGPNNNERQKSDSTVEISNVLGGNCDDDRDKLIAAELIADANSLLEEEDDEIVELETSNISLLSSLTPSSPLTIDASSNYLNSSVSMNLLHQSSTSIDIRNIGSGERRTSGLDPIDDELDTAFQSGLNNSENDATEDAENDIRIHSASQSHQQYHHSAQHKQVDNILTKHVTQRIDARTNFDCFTGEIDAITGHVIHGTMLYRKTGTVYEGPFITKYIEPQRKRRSNEGIIQSVQEEAGGDDIICDTIALRHGTNAQCHWTNGHSFKGNFEFDYPKSGTYSCKPPLTGTDLSGAQAIGDWSYTGPLLAVVVKGEESNNVPVLTSSSTPPASGNSDMSISNLRIGVSNPLPGSVVFHGKGRLERSDGLVYQGEF